MHWGYYILAGVGMRPFFVFWFDLLIFWQDFWLVWEDNIVIWLLLGLWGGTILCQGYKRIFAAWVLSMVLFSLLFGYWFPGFGDRSEALRIWMGFVR